MCSALNRCKLYINDGILQCTFNVQLKDFLRYLSRKVKASCTACCKRNRLAFGEEHK